MKMNSLFAVLLGATMSLPFLACSSDPVVDQNTNKVLEDLEIRALDGEDTTLSEGQTERFVVIAQYADNTTLDVTNDPGTVWTSSDTENATVDKTGLVTALDEGTVTITATYSGKSTNESLIITP